METVPIPKDDQILAMLEGRIFPLLREYGLEPEKVDFRRFITVTRRDLVEYLCEHPGKAKWYFEKFGMSVVAHDAGVIWQDGSEYVVAWMDHGQPRSVKRFKALNEAVAEHVLISHGMY